jgi:hypothetical protein
MAGREIHPRRATFARFAVQGEPSRMTRPITAVKTPWESVLLLCRKCSRKLDGGFGADGEDTLRAALRVELKRRGQARQCRIIETRCFGLCPKKAVTALDPARPGELVVIPARTPPAAALDRLLPEGRLSRS